MLGWERWGALLGRLPGTMAGRGYQPANDAWQQVGEARAVTNDPTAEIRRRGWGRGGQPRGDGKHARCQ